ncbi:hypothetical protein Pen01_07100 [Phytomonospora endophytica]|nr:hypothetical protein Pen01_07100 [Phytomonospora endophytica]
MVDATGGDGRVKHFLGLGASGSAEYHRDRSREEYIGPPPNLPSGRVIVDVLVQPVTVGEEFAHRGRTDLCHLVSSLCRPQAAADL